MTNIYFTSDLHIYHKNILRHCPERVNMCGAADENDVAAWDKWIMEKWNDVIKRDDIVYILGDFSFANTEWTRKILSKLRGKKFLILGNHDKSSEKLTEHFVQITQIKEVTFKKSTYDFLEEDFLVTMCHYPMITWNAKHYGACMIHGHCHGRLDDYNSASLDLRVDVGVDGKLANYGFIRLDELYRYFKEKTNGEMLRKFAMANKVENKIII